MPCQRDKTNDHHESHQTTRCIEYQHAAINDAENSGDEWEYLKLWFDEKTPLEPSEELQTSGWLVVECADQWIQRRCCDTGSCSERYGQHMMPRRIWVTACVQNPELQPTSEVDLIPDRNGMHPASTYLGTYLCRFLWSVDYHTAQTFYDEWHQQPAPSPSSSSIPKCSAVTTMLRVANCT